MVTYGCSILCLNPGNNIWYDTMVLLMMLDKVAIISMIIDNFGLCCHKQRACDSNLAISKTIMVLKVSFRADQLHLLQSFSWPHSWGWLVEESNGFWKWKPYDYSCGICRISTKFYTYWFNKGNRNFHPMLVWLGACHCPRSAFSRQQQIFCQK